MLGPIQPYQLAIKNHVMLIKVEFLFGKSFEKKKHYYLFFYLHYLHQNLLIYNLRQKLRDNVIQKILFFNFIIAIKLMPFTRFRAKFL